MLVIFPAQAGIPEAGLALICHKTSPLDMCRNASINVSGDRRQLINDGSKDKIKIPKQTERITVKP